MAISSITCRQMARGRKGSTSFLQLTNEAIIQEKTQLPISHIHCVTLPLHNSITCKGIGILWWHQSNPEWVSLLWNPGCMHIRRYLGTEECAGGNRLNARLAATVPAVASRFSLPPNGLYSNWRKWQVSSLWTSPASKHEAFPKIHNSFKTHLKTWHTRWRTFISIPQCLFQVHFLFRQYSLVNRAKL